MKHHQTFFGSKPFQKLKVFIQIINNASKFERNTATVNFVRVVLRATEILSLEVWETSKIYKQCLFNKILCTSFNVEISIRIDINAWRSLKRCDIVAIVRNAFENAEISSSNAHNKSYAFQPHSFSENILIKFLTMQWTNEYCYLACRRKDIYKYQKIVLNVPLGAPFFTVLLKITTYSNNVEFVRFYGFICSNFNPFKYFYRILHNRLI